MSRGTYRLTRRLDPRALFFAAGVAACLFSRMESRADEPATPNQAIAVDTPKVSVSALDLTVEPPVAPPTDDTARGFRRKLGLTRTPTTDAPSAAPWYRTGGGALVVVLVLVGVLFAVVRKWSPSVRGGESGVMKVVSRTALSPRHSLALVHLGRRLVLVGISPDRVDAVTEVTDAEEVAELSARLALPMSGAKTPFGHLLSDETLQYAPVASDPPHRPASTRTRGGVSTASLRDLLHRLKALQSK